MMNDLIHSPAFFQKTELWIHEEIKKLPVVFFFSLCSFRHLSRSRLKELIRISRPFIKRTCVVSVYVSVFIVRLHCIFTMLLSCFRAVCESVCLCVCLNVGAVHPLCSPVAHGRFHASILWAGQSSIFLTFPPHQVSLNTFIYVFIRRSSALCIITQRTVLRSVHILAQIYLEPISSYSVVQHVYIYSLTHSSRTHTVIWCALCIYFFSSI